MFEFLKCLFPFLFSQPQPSNQHLYQPATQIQHQHLYQSVNQQTNQDVVPLLRKRMKSLEKLPVFTYNYLEKRQVRQILANHVDEINLVKIIISYTGMDDIYCCKCSFVCDKGSWIKSPCDHFVHKKCWSKICPSCHESCKNCD